MEQFIAEKVANKINPQLRIFVYFNTPQPNI